MPPFVFIENDRFTQVPTVEKKWLRKGPAAKDFEAVDVLPTLTRKAVEYIGSHAAAAKAGTPFFLYLALNSPHTPILPTKEYEGKSGLGKYGDFVMETDGALGRVLETLDPPDWPTIRWSCSRATTAVRLRPTSRRSSGRATSQRRLSRLQGRHLGRRASHSVHRPLARPGEDRIAERPVDLPDGPDGDLCRDAARQTARQCRRRQRKHSAGPGGRRQGAASRGGGPSFDPRHVRHPPGQLEIGTMPRLRRLEQAGRSAGTETRPAGNPVVRHDPGRGRASQRAVAASGGGSAADAVVGEVRCRRPEHAGLAAEERRARGFPQGETARATSKAK